MKRRVGREGGRNTDTGVCNLREGGGEKKDNATTTNNEPYLPGFCLLGTRSESQCATRMFHEAQVTLHGTTWRVTNTKKQEKRRPAHGIKPHP